MGKENPPLQEGISEHLSAVGLLVELPVDLLVERP